MFAISRPSWFHKGLPTFCAVVLLDLKRKEFSKSSFFRNSHPIVPFHMDDQGVALPERFGTQTALELLEIEMDPLVVLQNLRVEEALAAPLKLALVRPLPRVSDHVPLQGVLVAAPLSTFRTDHLLVFVVGSHLVPKKCRGCEKALITLVTMDALDPCVQSHVRTKTAPVLKSLSALWTNIGGLLLPLVHHHVPLYQLGLPIFGVGHFELLATVRDRAKYQSGQVHVLFCFMPFIIHFTGECFLANITVKVVKFAISLFFLDLAFL